MMTKLDTALLTVLEAKAKWCPEARTVIYDSEDDAGYTVNRWDTGVAHPNSGCLADQCMFWRWHDRGERGQPYAATAPATRVETTGGGVWGRIPRPEDGQDWQLDEDENLWYVEAPALAPRGFCGKAGHPHQAMLHGMQMELLNYQLSDHRSGAL